MASRKASAVWTGSSREGSGKLALGSGAFSGPYTWKSRFAEGPETNPEELIAAAHAGCFSMALSSNLTKAGHVPARIDTTAEVHMDASNTIDWIQLTTEVAVDGLDEAGFLAIAEKAKGGCPVSKALAAVEIRLDARLAG
jgi:osmotically inducible protein OsmC